jgi:hypothetical protein
MAYMDSLTINQLTRHFRRFQFVLRNDSEARGQFWILVLGIITCLMVYYVGVRVVIAPKEKKLRASLAQQAEIVNRGSNQQLAGLAPRIAQLEQKTMDVQDDIAILGLREKFQREQWRSLADIARFNNIIFTMTPAAPINIEGKLQQMNLGEKRTLEMYDEQPIRLSGKGKYRDVLSYLRYLENSPEIGGIDNLILNALTAEEPKNSDLVHFSLQVSRILLKEP